MTGIEVGPHGLDHAVAVADARAAALRELTAIVGREVVDVVRVRIARGRSDPQAGLHQPLGWRFEWGQAGGTCLSFTSDDMRRPWRCAEVAATHWRRPEGMPPLTAEDGRRVIRLMHEAIEARDAMNNEMRESNDEH